MTSHSPTTEEQVQWLTDRAQIHDLVLQYARTADTKDYEGYANLFSDDGRILWPLGRIDKKDIARSISVILGPFERTHHLFANIGIEIEGDTARSNHYLQAVHVGSGADSGDHADIGGWYNNHYRRTPDGWKIVSVELNFIWSGGSEFNPGSPAG